MVDKTNEQALLALADDIELSAKCAPLVIAHTAVAFAHTRVADWCHRIRALASRPADTGERGVVAADLAAVMQAAAEASAVPLQWQASADFTPEQCKDWLAEAVSENVKAGDFTGELHSIAELESGLTVAFTGCGPKSAANAKFLIWCAHFILKHGETVMAALRAQPAGGGDVVFRMRFGEGAIGVFTGTYEGEPAVLLYEAPKPGSVGDEVSHSDGMPLRCALMFPTAEQAQAVMDALAPAATSEPTPTGWVRNTDGKWEVRIGGPCPANRSGGYSTPWTAVYDTPTARLAFATPPESGGQGVDWKDEANRLATVIEIAMEDMRVPRDYLGKALGEHRALTQGGGNGR